MSEETSPIVYLTSLVFALDESKVLVEETDESYFEAEMDNEHAFPWREENAHKFLLLANNPDVLSVIIPPDRVNDVLDEIRMDHPEICEGIDFND